MKKLFVRMIMMILIFGLTYVPCFAANITLRWDANDEDDLAGYNLYYKTDESGISCSIDGDSDYNCYLGTGSGQGSSPVDIPLDTPGFDPNDPEFTITGLDADHIYFLVLTAYDDAGNESGYSNEVYTFYISHPQNGFYVNSTNHTAFNVSGRGAAGYDVEVYSDETSIGTTIADVDGAWSVDVDFTDVVEDRINLSARTTVISEITSNVVTGTLDITAPAPPGIPQGLRVDAMSESQIDLEWNTVGDADGYIIYRDDTEIAKVAGTKYNDIGLSPSTTYEYEIASYNGNGDSGRSTLESATTLDDNNNPPGSDSSDGCFIDSIYSKSGVIG